MDYFITFFILLHFLDFYILFLYFLYLWQKNYLFQCNKIIIKNNIESNYHFFFLNFKIHFQFKI